MFCPRCGTHNDDNAWKCVNCQGELHVQDQGAPSPFQSQAAETSMKAVLSIIFGFLGLCCCNLALGPIAIILGILSRKEIRENPERWKGEALAIIGIVLGSIDIILGIINMIVFIVFMIRGENPFPFPLPFKF
ncbi:DUF4190 domain-containing protein [Candidatus Sumerlaeota bacterium]|nr:DUF4190 domain-containing protein [Candidatus Sumerlaeota bacterium]